MTPKNAFASESPETKPNCRWFPVTWRAWLVAFLCAAAGFCSFTRHNDFPFFYHLDEPSKVQQLLTGERNFHHPLLMLKSTELLLQARGVAETSQSVVMTGRVVSAIYGALAIAGLVVLAWQLGGPTAGTLAGIFLLAHPALFELAHYMKEDCTLLGGMAWCFAGLAWYAHRPSWTAAVLSGVAAGFAVSGKYIGLSVAVAGVLVILKTRTGKEPISWKATFIFLVATLVVFGVINMDGFLAPKSAAVGLNGELGKLNPYAREDSGFHFLYIRKLATVVSIPILFAAGYWAIRRWKQRHTQSIFVWVLLGYPLLLLLVLSLLNRVRERYFLPIYMIFCVLGALGIAEIARDKRLRHARLLACSLGFLALAFHYPMLVECYRGFSVDDRRDLCAWLRNNVPPNAVIASDRRSRMEEMKNFDSPAYSFPQTVAPTRRFVADLGTLEELRMRGVGYVVACEQNYGDLLGGKSQNTQDAARANFYKALFKEGKLLWQSPSGTLPYLHPGLRVYQIN